MKTIIIAGVGGQGVLTASDLLSDVLLDAGYSVKKSEVHGMSQRGGVVTSHVRFGGKVSSPLIPSREADAILAFELAEGLRWVGELAPAGTMIVNNQKIIPVITTTGKFSYPENVAEKITEHTKDAIFIDAYDIAVELGNSRLVNTILLGVLSKSLDLDEAEWLKVIEKMAPKGTGELNKKAFLAGRSQ